MPGVDKAGGDDGAGLVRLPTLSLAGLRAEWRRFYPGEAPGSMSRELLRLAIGYKLQEQVSGGLGRRTLLALSSRRDRTKGGAIRSAPPKSGTKFIREWQGTVHEVLTLEDGRFAYRGKIYRSLTVIARLITGTHQSGPLFFGLRRRGPAGGARD